MKKIIKYILLFSIIFTSLWIFSVNAEVDFTSIEGRNNIIDHSISNIDSTWDITADIITLWLDFLTIAKFILAWVLIIYIVYAWIQMIMSMWNDEEKLSASKRQLRYSLIWFIFINIPGTIYEMFTADKTELWGAETSYSWVSSNSNIFIHIDKFDETLNGGIITFVEIVLLTVAIFVITIAWIKIMTSRWREENVTEAKNKITWSIIWLIFVGFIEAWQNVVYKWDVWDWADLFETMENIALFFAWPVAIFFLTLAWYYYITSNWDEERVKKAKSIVVNIVLATLILLASHAFLKDLLTL